MEKQRVFITVEYKKEKPEYSEDILISYDNGETFPESAAFRKHTQCMLAGVGGGNGYFGEGFCTNGSTGCETGLILPDVTHWLREQDCYLFTEEEYNNLSIKE